MGAPWVKIAIRGRALLLVKQPDLHRGRAASSPGLWRFVAGREDRKFADAPLEEGSHERTRL
jgi:hypothetical protein